MFSDANTTWFNFRIAGGNFSVYAFTGTEEVHKPYEFAIELVSRSANENITDFIGREACLTILDKSGAVRPVHGVIRAMEQLHTANVRTHYRCHLVPRLWFLDKIIDHRIFQDKNVPEIIEQILKEQGFGSETFEFKIFFDYKPREYCVQYGETDLHFISRLCEEEGLYFYFEHSLDGHKLCFCDRENGPSILGESKLRYYPGSGNVAETAVISAITLHKEVHSNATTYREWNFTKPNLNQQVGLDEIDKAKAPTPPGMTLEQYRYPHLYQDPQKGEAEATHGQQYANVQLARQITFANWIDGESNVARFVPSFVFSVYEHPRTEINEDWWVVRTVHHGEQPGVLEHEAPSERGLEYKSKFTAIPRMTRFVPENLHRKNRVDGVQSAIVTGPGSEEVYTDKYGRVKVQFHWDREGTRDEHSSCWIRVSAGWAGANFGFMHLPRIGQEVLVECLEGDPDRPIITGRVYYETNLPPWQLPEQKHLSGIQSREFKAGRRNQLVLDDTNGEIQAQLASDHDATQLNLGYLTRVNHVEGRKDFRGEGFELRTDGWGVVRAGKGLVLSTNARNSAIQHHKSMEETTSALGAASKQHADMVNLAEAHNAQTPDTDGDMVALALEKQQEQIQGNGEEQKELNAPHLVLASPAGIAATTPKSLHLHTGESIGATSGKHLSITAGRSFFATALDKIGIFAHKMGIKIFAGKGKVEIQAQSDDLEIIADKVLKIISAKEKVHISATKEILLTSGGSYIRINSAGIEQGTSGQWTAHGQSHSMMGPNTMPPIVPQWNKSDLQLPGDVTLFDEMNRPISVKRSVLSNDNSQLHLFHEAAQVDANPGSMMWGNEQRVVAVGDKMDLTEELARDKKK